MAAIYGIDLGTTYSCIARIDEHGKPEVVPNSEGEVTTPSVVYFESKGSTAVGNAAKEEAELNPDRVISVVKQQMGTDWTTEQFGEEYTAPAVSAFILRKVIGDAEKVTGDKIAKAVITCPAYFGVAERQATRDAGVMAGLEVDYVISEPTAAAFSHSLDQESTDQTVLVYDLGGGTFDVTVLRVEQHQIKVVCTGGDHSLGGKDWDTTIAEWVGREFARETDADFDDLRDDPEIWNMLMAYAEAAKLSLTSKQTYKKAVAHDVGRAVVELTREKFDQLTEGHLSRTLSLTTELLGTAKEKGYDAIDKILLVGGSTYMPQVRAAVEERFPSIEVKYHDPNQAVAKGAALMALNRVLDDLFDSDNQGEPSGEEMQAAADELGMSLPEVEKIAQKQIFNVTSKSFGVVVQRRPDRRDDLGVNNLITVNDQVPVEVKKTYGTSSEGQTSVRLVCVENLERSGPNDRAFDYDESQKVGEAELSFDRPLPRGSEVQVTIRLGEDGLLAMHGLDLTTNNEISAEFISNAILTREQVEAQKTLCDLVTVD